MTKLDLILSECGKKIAEELSKKEITELFYSTDPDILFTTLKKEITSNLTKDEVLKKIALCDPSCLVRLRAISKLKDEETLERIAVSDKHVMCQLEAVKKINDVGKLINILCKPNLSLGVKRAAINNIESQTDLEKISKSDNFILEVRCLAIDKLLSEEVLESFVVSDDEDDVIKEAANRRLWQIFNK